MLISSCESTKITTSCRTAFNRRTLEPTRKRYSVSKDGEATAKWWEAGKQRKSNLMPPGWATRDRRTMIPETLSSSGEEPEPQVRLPSLGV